MFIKTKNNKFINTSIIESFEVKKARNSEEYAILASNSEHVYVIETHKSYIIAFHELEIIINSINAK